MQIDSTLPQSETSSYISYQPDDPYVADLVQVKLFEKKIQKNLTFLFRFKLSEIAFLTAQKKAALFHNLFCVNGCICRLAKLDRASSW